VTSLCLALLLLAPSDDPWAPLRFLAGKWEGTSQGKPGLGKTTREYQFDLRGRYLTGRNKAVYEKETHEDFSVFSFDRLAKKLVLRQFHVEGFVNHYVLAAAEDQKLEFVTERIENIPEGWRAKETYTLVGPDEFVETFSLAAPGKEFEVYSESRLKRVTASGSGPGRD
jgi:hypothetical protein